MRRLALAILCALVAMLAAEAPAHAVGDPSLRWYTIHTPHFRVTYHSGIEAPAQRVADIAEHVYDEMVAHVGAAPSEVVEIALADSTESANGAAGALPYDAIHLLITAPEDMSPLGDVDDWYLELVTHEFTHVLHTDNIHGIPALVNAILGKTLAPNQTQPRWILEGLGVYHESARTTGGRLRNSQWDMWMRADVLEDNVAPIDQISNTVRRWPQGNLYYLYGSYFTQYVATTYGEDALRRAARDYGGQLIPWGFNRSIRRATGKTYVEMYPEWIASMKKQYGAQAAAVRAKGLREGVRITHSGQTADYPRWVPDNAWPEHKGGLLYFRDDGHTRGGLWALDVTRDASGNVTKSDDRHMDQIARTAMPSYASFTPAGGVVFSSQDNYKDVYQFGDLEEMPPRGKSPFALQDGGRKQIAPPSLRADMPDVSPDGRRVVFTTNRAGTRLIRIGDLRPGGVENVRILVPSAFLEQAFTPRWSPDGKLVAYSVWKTGGYRDIRIVDVGGGSYRDITFDRAVDGAPSFSADGRYLFFHSDRTGIMNVYAFELATERLFQVTNVINGAYQPAPSPDGKTLVYVGYTHEGFDLYAMPLDPATWTPAEPPPPERGEPPAIPAKKWTVKPFDPWLTMLPRRYGVQITQGSWGQAIIVNASGSDVVGFHTVAASTTTEIEKPELQGSLSYTYAGLPFDFSTGISRTITPRSGYALGGYKPTIVQESTGFSTTLAYTKPSPVDTSSFVVSHTIARIAADLPMPIDKLDPYDTPQLIPRGIGSTIHLGYAYSNAERFTWGVSAEKGISFQTGIDFTHPFLGSDFDGFVIDNDLTTYWLMPWLEHHAVAVHVGGGTSGGTLPGRGAFFVGSFVDVPLTDVLRSNVIQGGVTLRGYQPVVLSGRSYLLTNTEYRFPIWNVDRGPETLPIFLNRISGTFFFDYGSAFDVIDDAKFKTGAGGELWFDMTLGYLQAFTFRLGFAHGFASGGIDKGYFVAAIPY
jgi:hypothetical protein